jgi:F420-non-reducing hydrogenase iron-sulfur subunit
MKTARRIPLLKKMLAQFGIEEERVRLDWVSASEGDRFANIVNEMTEQVRKLGPFGGDGSG